MRRKLKRWLREKRKAWRAKGKTKYFCVGRNKTGTTSLEKAFVDLGYPVGKQREAEHISERHYSSGNFQPIIDYCKSAQVFQDTPFSLPGTYRHLDKAYPDSKFILTVRDSAEQWYQSKMNFIAKKFCDGTLPDVEGLKKVKYLYEGDIYRSIKMHGTKDDDIYNKAIMMAHYEKYNQEVMDYFSDRPDDLLVINLSEKGSYKRFIEFLGVESPYDDFPWENKT